MGRLAGKVAYISGAAGGIGAATARLFVAEGARVALADVDAGALGELAAELGEDVAVAARADVTDSAQVRASVALAVERFGGLDVAFANAGVFGVVADVVDYPEDVFDQVLAVNVRGSFLVAKHALAVMRDGGSLIVNSSVAGLTTDPGSAPTRPPSMPWSGWHGPRPRRSRRAASASTRCTRARSPTTSSAASRSRRPASLPRAPRSCSSR